MKIIILGAGQAGASVAENLVSEANDITLVDTSTEYLDTLRERLELRTVCGNGASPSVLREAGADDADLLIAVTQSDRTNLCACLIGKALFNLLTRIARLRSGDYTEHPELLEDDKFAVDFSICPVSWGRCVVWTDRKEEFVKKAGFTLMGALADFEMKADDTQFPRFIPIIERCGNDDRLFVKKAAAYALGAIGRRSPALKKMCAETADRMAENASKAAQFVGKGAQKEMAKPRPKAS